MLFKFNIQYFLQRESVSVGRTHGQYAKLIIFSWTLEIGRTNRNFRRDGGGPTRAKNSPPPPPPPFRHHHPEYYRRLQSAPHSVARGNPAGVDADFLRDFRR